MQRSIRQSLCSILVALVAATSTGCAYLHTQRPLSVNYQKTELGTKEGRASAYSLFWLVAWGDAGNKAAAKNGDIKVINCADAEILSVFLGLYTRMTTVVYGD